jgi:hypothetical protein
MLREIKKKLGIRVDFDFHDAEFWWDVLRWWKSEDKEVLTQKAQSLYMEYRKELLKDKSPYYTWRVPASVELPTEALKVIDAMVKERDATTDLVHLED